MASDIDSDSRDTSPDADRASNETARRYEPLDGVRALAICTVLAFHTGGQWLSGGFLGVDVFFVLSGYLMIGILASPDGRGLRMPARTFWLRRARRLAPSLLTVVLAVVVVAHVADRYESPGLRGDVIAALAYVTNWWSLHAGAEYFNQWQEPSALLQTWSLSIEEQFYLILPALIVVLTRLRASARVRTFAFAGLAAMSAAWALHLQQGDPLRVYFGSDTRVQALFAGVVLGLMARPPGHAGQQRPTAARQAVGWACLVGLIALFVLAAPWTESMPAWILTVCALLTVGLLWAIIQAEHSFLAQVFSWRPLVWIGAISYALYLWHWPVFLWIQGGRHTPLGAQVWAIAVSVVLAWLTTRFIERPVRGPRFSSLPTSWQWAIYGACAGLLATMACVPLLNTGGGDAPDESQWPAAAELPASVTLFGDSTAYTAAGGFPHERYPKLTFTYLAPLGCGIRDRHLQQEGINAAKPECDGWQDRWSAYMDWAKPEATVLMENVWELYDVVDGVGQHPPGTPEYTRAVTAAVSQALDLTAPPGGGPEFVIGVPCHAATAELDGEVLNEREREAALNAILRQQADARPNVHFIDMGELTCGPQGAVNEINGVTLRDDGVHWSGRGRAYLWAYVLDRISREMSTPGTR